jgi:hypothetical protein
MRRIKFNTTWEEDEEERWQFFAGLSYGERLIYFIEGRKKINFHRSAPKRFDLTICGQFDLRAPSNFIETGSNLSL